LLSRNCGIPYYTLQEGQGKGGAVDEVKLKVNRVAGFSPSNREGQVSAGDFGNFFAIVIPAMRNCQSGLTHGMI